MEDLIKLLQEKAGLTETQAVKSLSTIKEYIQSKLPPMMSGMVDNFMGGFGGDADDDVYPGTSINENKIKDKADIMNKAKVVTQEAAEKIEGIAEEAKEEVEEFAREASEQIDKWAEKAAQEAISKLKDMLDEQETKNN